MGEHVGSKVENVAIDDEVIGEVGKLIPVEADLFRSVGDVERRVQGSGRGSESAGRVGGEEIRARAKIGGRKRALEPFAAGIANR